MTTTEPNIPDSGRYPIGLAAELLGMHRDTLWRKAKQERPAIKHVVNKLNGRKHFSGYEIKKFWRSQF